MRIAAFFLVLIGLTGCEKKEEVSAVMQWTTFEISLQSEQTFSSPYTEVEVWADFKNDKGVTLQRPAFWDGGNAWKIRFTPPDTAATWTWATFASADDKGLVGKAGGTGLDPGVKPGGEEVEKWDAYQQPTGIHYNPADDYMPVWAQGDSSKCFHYNRSHQAEPWLDFQWAQTGHDGKHIQYKVARMYDEKPTKAVLNGEPTYEGMGGGKHGLGWWQGEEAWSNLMNGGTMGVVYGAATLWQWKLTPDEPGWDTWTDQPLSWREAIDLEGSNYIGFIREAFYKFDFTDMEKRWDLTEGNKPLLAKEGKFYVAYLPESGEIKIKNIPDGLDYFWFDPVKGETTNTGKAGTDGLFSAPGKQPWVLLIGKKP